MANRLEFSASLDGSGFKSGLQEMAAEAEKRFKHFREQGISIAPKATAANAGTDAERKANDASLRQLYDNLQKRKALTRDADNAAVMSATEAQIKIDAAKSKSFTKTVGMSAAARRIARADAKLESAVMALHEGFAPGIQSTKEELRPLRDQVAIALRERRALRAGGKFGGLSGGSMAVSSTMFISAARDSMASLASGANPFTVFMQQAPQIAQGFTMMGVEALKASLRFIGIGAAVLAVGAALYALYRRFANISQEIKNFRELTDLTNVSLQTQDKVLKDGLKTQQENVDWLEKQGAGQRDLKEATDEAIASLREKAGLEKQLAQAKGASPRQLARMEIEQAKAEAKMLAQAAKDAEASAHRTFLERKTAEEQQLKFNLGGNSEKLAQAKLQEDEARKVAEAIREKMRTANVAGGVDVAASRAAAAAGGTGFVMQMRPATAADRLEVEVNGKKYNRSLSEARDAVAAMATEAGMLERSQHDLDKTVKEKTARFESESKSAKALQIEADKAASSARLKEQFLEKIAGGGAGKTPSDSLTSVGNFLGSSRDMIGTLAQKQVDLLRQIESNTRPRTASTGESTTYPMP